MLPHLILCEKSTHWAAPLRAALPSGQPQLIETRSLAGCTTALAHSPTSLVALEITLANLEAAVDFLTRSRAQHPYSAVTALLSPETLAADALLREAGAIDTLASTLEAPRLARLALRHFRQLPQPPLDDRNFLADRLPWPAHATARQEPG
jgi:hypothetical protein